MIKNQYKMVSYYLVTSLLRWGSEKDWHFYSQIKHDINTIVSEIEYMYKCMHYKDTCSSSS